jgi:hypothetical protein
MSTIDVGVERMAKRIEASHRSKDSELEANQQEQILTEKQQHQEIHDRVEISQASHRRLEEAKLR